MNKAAIGCLVVGVAGGFLTGQLLKTGKTSKQAITFTAAASPKPLETAEIELNELRRQIATLQAENKILVGKLTGHGGQTADVFSLVPAANEPAENELGEDEASSEYNELYNQALAAMDSGNRDEATKLFNKLLARADNDEQREQAKDFLLSLLQDKYDELSGSGGNTNATLWTLFEMHKLRPNPAVRADVIQLSKQAYQQAQQHRSNGDLLASADNLASLMHLSHMLNFNVVADNGKNLKPGDFKLELSEIERLPEYQQRLSQRAQNNLYNGTEQEQAIVFWDYAHLVDIHGSSTLESPDFREQFVQATTRHLSHLNEMNQADEVKSRLNFIRYAYPTVMSDERIARYY